MLEHYPAVVKLLFNGDVHKLRIYIHSHSTSIKVLSCYDLCLKGVTIVGFDGCFFVSNVQDLNFGPAALNFYKTLFGRGTSSLYNAGNILCSSKLNM